MSSQDGFDTWEAMAVKQLRALKRSLVLKPPHRWDAFLIRPSLFDCLFVSSGVYKRPSLSKLNAAVFLFLIFPASDFVASTIGDKISRPHRDVTNAGSWVFAAASAVALRPSFPPEQIFQDVALDSNDNDENI
jgi:hypothetical protein